MISVRSYLFLIFPFSLLASSTIDISQFPDGTEDVAAWIYFVDQGPEETEGLDVNRTHIGSSPVDDSSIPRASHVQSVLDTGVRLRHRSLWFNAVSVKASLDQLLTIGSLECVSKIEPVRTFSRPRPQTWEYPERFRAGGAITGSLDYGLAQEQIEQIHVDSAHENGYFGQDVTILVMDTGFNLSHPVFDSLNLVAQWDVIENDSITSNQSTGDTLFLYDKDSTIIGISGTQHDHGTMVLSALAGYDPGNLIGPAFQSRYLLAKTEILKDEIRIEEDNYVAGLEWGEANGAQVVSTSLGYLDWYEYTDLDGNTAVTTRAIDIAVSRGMVCITAAGNEGNSDWVYILTPADADSVISVGAVNASGTITSFSSHGPTADGRIKPEVCARGYRTACANPRGSGYRSASGTSLATPLVSGSVALLLSAHREWSPMQVREALLTTASQADAPDNRYGYGIVNAWDAILYTDFRGWTIPEDFVISKAYPNPFNPQTQFRIEIPDPGWIKVGVYDLLGKEVDLMMDEYRLPGIMTLSWDGSDYSSGLYFIMVRHDNDVIVNKVTLLK